MGKWFSEELQRRKAITPLTGLGCAPVIVKGSGKGFLHWIGRAVKRGVIHVHGTESSITWPSFWEILETETAREDLTRLGIAAHAG